MREDEEGIRRAGAVLVGGGMTGVPVAGGSSVSTCQTRGGGRGGRSPNYFSALSQYLHVHNSPLVTMTLVYRKYAGKSSSYQTQKLLLEN